MNPDIEFRCSGKVAVSYWVSSYRNVMETVRTTYPVTRRHISEDLGTQLTRPWKSQNSHTTLTCLIHTITPEDTASTACVNLM